MINIAKAAAKSRKLSEINRKSMKINWKITLHKHRKVAESCIMASGIAIHKSIIVERGGQYDTNADKTDPNINNPWKLWSWLEFVTKTGDRLSESFRKLIHFCLKKHLSNGPNPIASRGLRPLDPVSAPSLRSGGMPGCFAGSNLDKYV